MPEDLPKAVIILLWLLIGFIVFGYLLMVHGWLLSLAFLFIFYALPGIWLYTRPKQGSDKGT